MTTKVPSWCNILSMNLWNVFQIPGQMAMEVGILFIPAFYEESSIITKALECWLLSFKSTVW